MTRLPILTDPNEELRQTAEPFLEQEVTSKESQTLFDDMIETMKLANGVGLAGPQVGLHKRVLVGLFQNAPHIFINPEIVKRSLRKVDSEEGCLSIPGVWGIVRRHRHITVEYTDRSGQKQKRKLSGLEGIVVQHETDHLDGVLFTDKVIRLTTTPNAL